MLDLARGLASALGESAFLCLAQAQPHLEMEVILTGSVAFDYLMRFPGRFRDHILPDHLDALSLSFLVDSLDRRRGGVAANIGYTLALLGERPKIMATVGDDFDEYREFLETAGVDTSLIREIPNELTASFFVTTDQDDAQIASFYTGAMAKSRELSFGGLKPVPQLVVISPNDPQAMIAYAAECAQLGLPYFYDPSQQILRLEPQQLIDGITGAEALFLNEYELALVADKVGMEIEQIVGLPRLSVITLGERGSDLYLEGGHQRINAVVPQGPAEPTGVGDAYRGGFLKGYLHQLPLACCCMIGSLAATYCLEGVGPQGHRFEPAEFAQRFEKQFGPECDLQKLLS